MHFLLACAVILILSPAALAITADECMAQIEQAITNCGGYPTAMGQSTAGARSEQLRSRGVCGNADPIADCQVIHETVHICCLCKEFKDGTIDPQCRKHWNELKRRLADKYGDKPATAAPKQTVAPGATPKPGAKKPKKADLGCFHGEELVETREGKISMRELANQGTGTEVLAWDHRTGRLVFSPVDYWIHADTHKNALFRVLHTNGGKQMSLTSEHLIYKQPSCQGTWETAMSEQVNEGDCVRTTEGVEAVVRVRTESKRGFFAPMTRVGSVVVNDVVASCFVTTNTNEDLHRFVFGYTLAARDVLQHLLPASFTEFLFGASDQPISHISPILKAFARFEKAFLA